MIERRLPAPLIKIKRQSSYCSEKKNFSLVLASTVISHRAARNKSFLPCSLLARVDADTLANERCTRDVSRVCDVHKPST